MIGLGEARRGVRQDTGEGTSQKISLERWISNILISHAARRISKELGERAVLIRYAELREMTDKLARDVVEDSAGFVGDCIDRVEGRR